MSNNEIMNDFKIERLIKMKDDIQKEFNSIEVRLKQLKISQKQLQKSIMEKM